jgi:murein DD-endopeptidase MepM/ murein hydrolase activator NlpD
MHIILVSNRLSAARSLTITGGHMVAAGGALLALVLVLSAALFYFTLRHAAEIKLPFLETLVAQAQEQQAAQSQTFLQQNLNAMAVKVGDMQAQLMRLDALGERLVSMSGMKLPDFHFNDVPGRGGALPPGAVQKNLSMDDLNGELDRLSGRLENRGDTLGVLESQLFDANVKSKLMPTVSPVGSAYNGSGFGLRIDPITGMQAMHEGIDFIADVGTPIHAAASGVVIYAEFHHQYGNMVEIDHGNDFTTRYAHTSKMLVKVGDFVQRGAKIAEVGDTGRTTGPHLHFEVRYKGVAQNPARFLQASAAR